MHGDAERLPAFHRFALRLVEGGSCACRSSGPANDGSLIVRPCGLYASVVGSVGTRMCFRFRGAGIAQRVILLHVRRSPLAEGVDEFAGFDVLVVCEERVLGDVLAGTG